MRGQREIGGNLELEWFSGPALHEGDVALNCGRSCFKYFVELRGIQPVLLSDFLCSSVSNLCRKVAEGEWLDLVDYYGQLTRGDVEAAIDASGCNIIVDESQGYYREPWEGADTLYTCRKWFGVADGAFLHARWQVP